MKTRVPVLALIAAVLFASLSSPALASQAKVFIPQYHVEPGVMVQVSVKVENVTGLYGYQLTITYDPTHLEVVDSNPHKPGIQVLPGRVFSQLAAEPDVHVSTPGIINYYAVSGPLGQSAPQFSGNGELLRINFVVKRLGIASLALSDVQLSNKASQPIAATIQHGAINVTEAPPPPPPPADPGPSNPPPDQEPPKPPQPEVPRLQTVSEKISTTTPTLISFPDTAASVLIPLGSVPQGASVTISQQEPEDFKPLVGNNTILGKPVALEVASGHSKLTELDTPLRIDLRPDGEVTDEQLKKLGLYYYDDTHKVWVLLASEYDKATNGFVAEHNRTGIFALLLDKTAPAQLAAIQTQAKGQTITIQGMAEPLATIELYSAGSRISTTRADIKGRYSIQVTLPIGKHAVTLRQVDQIGNVSELSTEITVTSDWLVHIMLALNSQSFTLNRQQQTLEVPPRVVNGRTMVPLRLIAEALGAEVWWTADDNVAHIRSADLYIQLPIGLKAATVNGKPVTLDVAPFAENGRTLVPVRFVTETFGCEVIWHENTNEVEIRK